MPYLASAMTRTEFSRTVEISVPPALVWSVMADIERWPEWTPSVSRVKRLSPGPLRVGSRVRIHQPKLPPAWWRVTELNPDAGFTSVSVAPGVRVMARHWIEPAADGCRVTLSIRYEGLLGALLARWVGDLNDRYLALEADGLKARCVSLALERRSLNHETH
jgi:ribosome-associated toxin RatA of RatAB toxin-antitoxin module